MKIKEVFLKELEGKHYSTEVCIFVDDFSGKIYPFRIDLCGYYPQPSFREYMSGWEPEMGMDHVENEAQYKIALAIVDALEGKVLA